MAVTPRTVLERCDAERARAERAMRARDVAHAALDEAIAVLSAAEHMDARTFAEERDRVLTAAAYAKQNA